VPIVSVMLFIGISFTTVLTLPDFNLDLFLLRSTVLLRRNRLYRGSHWVGYV
jgi:hypothetical protein